MADTNMERRPERGSQKDGKKTLCRGDNGLHLVEICVKIKAIQDRFRKKNRDTCTSFYGSESRKKCSTCVAEMCG